MATKQFSIPRGAEVLWVEPFKKGVKRLHIRNLACRPPEFALVYVKDAEMPDSLLPWWRRLWRMVRDV